jgi:AcrR family transcriptional regulator
MDAEGALRERLVDVGVELVLTEGTASLGLREIARRAGVSHGAPRRYFPSHRSLLSAIARRGFDELSARSAAATAQTSPPRDQLAAMAHVYIAYALERRGMFELMFRHDLLDSGQRDGPPGGPPLREATLPMFARVVELVELVGRCREAADGLPADGLPADVVAAALWSNLHGVAQLWCWGSLQLATGGDSPDRLIEAALEAYLGPATA